jgi:hypothetical protein
VHTFSYVGPLLASQRSVRHAVFGLLSLSLAAIGCAAGADDAAELTAEANVQDACLATLECAAPPAPDSPKPSFPYWRNWIVTPGTVTHDPVTLQPRTPNHRGRDLFVNPGDPQWIIAQFAYGTIDVDLDDELVDIYAQRDCGSGWEHLGTATTTKGNAPHAMVEGVSDHGGRVYFQIPNDKRFGPGRHRVRLIVRGDQSFTELFIDVVPKGTPMFISDVDGTLTSSEHIEYAALLLGVLPATHEGAPEALRALAAKGYRPMYLTARPEPLVGRTREFLAKHGYPPGIVHTSTSLIGAPGQGGAAAFKSGEIAMLAQRGLTPAYAFGNKGTDSQAYATIKPAANRFFYQIEGDFDGRRIESYTELVPGFEALAPVCRK